MGVAAVWDKRKGLDDIVELSKQIEDQIIVVGVSEEQKRLLPEKICAYTRTNSIEELRIIYAIADVFVNPTYEDNYPTTNLESIACGTPVITYETGGSGESAKLYGSVVQKGNTAGMIESVNKLPFLTKHGDTYNIRKEAAVIEYLSLY